MGKGLLLNGGSTSYVPLLFLDAGYTTTIINVWPTAASNKALDTDYGLAGPRVFRFEYYYLLNPIVAHRSFQAFLRAHGPTAQQPFKLKIFQQLL